MKGFKFTTTKNAIANLVRGGATAAVAIALPRFLTRSLDIEHFAAWSLILQIAAYASYLDFGLQTAIARFIAQAAELQQKERQAKLISTALMLLSLAGLIAFSLISIVIWQFPHLFGGVPSGLLPQFRHAALLLSLVACLLLPLSTYTGVLIGMHRNEIPALAIGGSRIAGAVAVIVVSRHTQSLTVLAFCVAIPNLFGGLIQVFSVHELIAEGRARLRHINRVVGNELLRFCIALTVWSFGMLLVSGLDVTIVGHFRFSAVGFYSIASMLITFFAGLTNAALGALMAPVAVLHARKERERILQILFASTRLTLIANLSLTAVIFLFGGTMLRLWVGPVYANSALPILKILAIAQTFRLMVAPYSVMLVSTGEQSKAIPAVICEALVNLIASVLGMMMFGAVGVACGTLVGASFGVLWIILRTMPSVKAFRIAFGEFLVNAVLPSSIPFLPLLILWLIRGRLRPLADTIGLGICALFTAVLGRWCFRHRFSQFG